MQLAQRAFNNYFNFRGRAGIREFILAHIIIVMVNICLLAVLLSFAYIGNLITLNFYGNETSYKFLNFAQFWAGLILMFSVGIGIAAVDCRRLHDLNMTSLWLVAAVFCLVVLSLYGFFTFATWLHIFFILILFIPADKRANRYGPARVAIMEEK